MAGFKLDRLTAFINIAQVSRVPTTAFVQLWEKLCKKIEAQEALQDATNAAQAAQQAQIVQILEDLGYTIAALNATQQVANAAGAAANVAQDTADAAGGGTAVSGSATDPAVTLAGTSWETGPIVNLTGVVAGDLTIAGTGPVQDEDATCSAKTFSGEYRIVEVVGGIDTVLATFSFSAFAPDFDLATINNTDAPSVAAFTTARSTTGAVSYRIDARRVSGGTLSDATLYIYARRS